VVAVVSGEVADLRGDVDHFLAEIAEQLPGVVGVGPLVALSLAKVANGDFPSFHRCVARSAPIEERGHADSRQYHEDRYEDKNTPRKANGHRLPMLATDASAQPAQESNAPAPEARAMMTAGPYECG
jgi:hypothetical protein